MFTFTLLALAALAGYTFYKHETLSPKLLVRETTTLAGGVVGATPHAARTLSKAVKAANSASELALKETGQEGPLGYRLGKEQASKATEELLKDFNKDLDESLAKSKAGLDALKAKQKKEAKA